MFVEPETIRMRNHILLLLIIPLTFTSCEKLRSPKDYLVFGTFYGFCHGEMCTELFKLQDGVLYEDQKDGYPNYQEDFYDGDFKKLDGSDYEIAKHMLDDFPLKLLDETDVLFGCPDCADQGGFYLEYKVDGVHKYFVLDQFKDNVPAYARSYLDEVNRVVQELQ